jgi:hypothetical protein
MAVIEHSWRCADLAGIAAYLTGGLGHPASREPFMIKWSARVP